jgi:ribosomal protein S8E
MSSAKKVCRNFLATSSCTYGDACKFLHTDSTEESIDNTPKNSETEVCKMYSRTRTCKYGDKCLYQHIAEERANVSNASPKQSKNLKIAKVQAVQKKRKENPVKTSENTLAIGRGADPIREKKLKKDKIDLHLDDEAYCEKRRILLETSEDFFCFRCQMSKKSRNRYEWVTSEGTKIICNACNGNLISKTR